MTSKLTLAVFLCTKVGSHSHDFNVRKNTEMNNTTMLENLHLAICTYFAMFYFLLLMEVSVIQSKAAELQVNWTWW